MREGARHNESPLERTNGSRQGVSRSMNENSLD